MSIINIIKKEIDVEESLRKRLEIICDFCNTTTTIINDSIRKIDKHNLRKYDEEQELIKTIKGTSSLVEDTRKKYNEKQTRKI